MIRKRVYATSAPRVAQERYLKIILALARATGKKPRLSVRAATARKPAIKARGKSS